MNFIAFRLSKVFGAALFAAVAFVGVVPSAEAKIRCIDGFQVVSGSRIATPYCQDELVAQVARQHGMQVSAASIRNNPNLKRNVCQLVGRDNRIHIACIDANSVGRRPF